MAIVNDYLKYLKKEKIICCFGKNAARILQILLRNLDS